MCDVPTGQKENALTPCSSTKGSRFRASGIKGTQVLGIRLGDLQRRRSSELHGDHVCRHDIRLDTQEMRLRKKNFCLYSRRTKSCEAIDRSKLPQSVPRSSENIGAARGCTSILPRRFFHNRVVADGKILSHSRDETQQRAADLVECVF